ncbi:MAG: efflux RND transporter permease subunit [Acidobacteria bacterium]|nr:efflux RND transporter permease subunit [Acidobacteriota bacterium]
MQKLAEICIRRPVFAAMMILALVVIGISSYTRLGVDRFPQVDIPTVSVRTTLPGAGPEEVETLVSDVIEEAVNTVEGIRELRSVSHSGRSTIIVNFELNRNIDAAAQDVRDRVATILRLLPEEVDPPLVSKYDNESTPVLDITLSGDKSVRELTELADKVVKPLIERSTGVGEVQIVGGLERAINIWADADRLAAYKLSITRVATALARQNADIPGGNITSGVHEEKLRTAGRLADPKAFNDLVIATVNQTPVRVSDIGYAEDGTKEQRSLARLNGAPAVVLNIRRQSGANTVDVIEGVKRNMQRAAKLLPAGVAFSYTRDQSEYITLALKEINLHLILGSVLASLVVLAFTRSWQSTVIAGIAIPVSVVATFGMMEALGFTLNSVTMLALVLMVGIVIDDAIIVVENIFRFIEEKGMGPFEAAREATRDIGMAVLATTLSLAVIFVPVSFMSSVSGRFLYQFGITAAVAILVSLFVSFTLTPTMGARLLKASHITEAASRQGFYRHIDAVYTALLRFSMRHRLAVSILAVAVAGSSIPLYRMVKQEYIPTDVDEAEFEVEINAPEGISLDGMNDVLLRMEREIRDVPGVREVLADIGGSQQGGGITRSDMFVRIAPHEERTLSISRILREGTGAFQGNYSQRDVMVAVRKKLARYKDLWTRVRNAPSFSLGGGNHEIDFVFRGPELLQLAKYTQELRRRAADVGGIVDADVTLKLNSPELRVEIDRGRAADLSVSTRDIAQALRIMVGGEEKVTRFRDQSLNEDYDVQLRLQQRDRDSANAISQLYVPRENGQLARLDSLVELVHDTSPTRIDRYDRQRQASLRAGVGPGFALADRIEALREAVREMNLPPAYTTSVSGRARELERTGVEFLIAFALSVAFMYMILASQFENLIHPLTILLSLPLSIPFALLSLWATGNTINLYSALGMLVLFGVVKKNSILQIDHMNNLRAKGMPRMEAIIQGNRDRLRPILMTTMALVAGMIPLAVGTGPGAEERRAVAVVVIGGQTLSLLLTLLVTPVAYSLFDDIGARWRAKEANTPASHPVQTY